MLALSATLVAAAIGLVYFSVIAPLPEVVPRLLEERRAALPGSHVAPTRAELVRLSKTHVAVNVNAFVKTSRGTPRQERVQVLLDTGSTVPLVTSAGQRLLGVTGSNRHSVPSRSFDGQPVFLPLLGDDQEVMISLSKRDDPLGVFTWVWLLTESELYGVAVVAHPLTLAPRGGAVLLDLPNGELTSCETASACGKSAEWKALSTLSCSEVPGLIGLRARIQGREARLLLDTAGSTLLFQKFFDDSGLLNSASSHRSGWLSGAAAEPLQASVAYGDWQIEIGEPPSMAVTTTSLWVVPATSSTGHTQCFPDGALGLDVLGNCQLLLGDEATPWARIACP